MPYRARVVWILIIIVSALTARTAMAAYGLVAAWRGLPTQATQPGAVALVLGHRLQADEAGPHLRQRLDRAYALYNAGLVDTILVSGGGSPPEAMVGKEYLVALGVRPGAILTETASCSTVQNIANSKRLLSPAGGNRTVYLISNRTHLPRALTIARDQDLPVVGIAAESAAMNPWSDWPNLLVEALALSVYPYWVNPPLCR